MSFSPNSVLEKSNSLARSDSRTSISSISSVASFLPNVPLGIGDKANLE